MNRNPAVVAAVRASDRAYFEQVGGSETLDHAELRFCDEYPAAAALHFATEVLIERAADAPAAVREIEAFFAARGRALGWLAPAATQPVDVLETVLCPVGYARERHVAWQAPPDAGEFRSGDLRLLSARAMRRAATTVLHDRWHARRAGEQLLAAALDRLDDAQYAGLVALADDEPLGFGALHQVGEIGRIRDVFVRPQHRRRGVASAIIRHALADARRWSLRPVCAAAPGTNAAAGALLSRLGFEQAGELARFRAPGAAEESE